MSTDDRIEVTKAELLYHYLGRRLAQGEHEHSIDSLVSEFELYCQELDSLRSLIQEAEESSARGQSYPVELQDVIRRGRERAAQQGIKD